MLGMDNLGEPMKWAIQVPRELTRRPAMAKAKPQATIPRLAAPEPTHDYDADPLMHTSTESERDEAPGEKTPEDFETADEAEPTHDAVSDETADAAPPGAAAGAPRSTLSVTSPHP